MSFEEAAGVLRDHAGVGPRIGIVLGSGLGEVAEAVEDPKIIGYEALPGFPRTGVEGHEGRAVLGVIRGVPVAVLQGRAHLYEGTDLERLRTPVRALCAAGAEILVLTNAAGSLRAELGPGRLMLICDHINMTGVNVLAGPNDDELGPRFPSLRDAYDPALRGEMHAAAEQLGARHCGLRVAAVSAISNLAEGLSDRPLSHEQTLHDAARAAKDLGPLLIRFVERVGE